jgi:hypothetical protein
MNGGALSPGVISIMLIDNKRRDKSDTLAHAGTEAANYILMMTISGRTRRGRPESEREREQPK